MTDHPNITPPAPGHDVTNTFYQCPVCNRVFASHNGWCSHCGVQGDVWQGTTPQVTYEVGGAE